MTIMYIVTVAPIKRAIAVEELSYFSRTQPPPGALVTVPLRGKMIPALVLTSTPANIQKGELKRSPYPLKKLERVEAKAYFPEAFVRAAVECARQHGTTTGATIQALFPNALLKKYPAPAIEKHIKRFGQRFVYQTDESERLSAYKSHIREIFAHGGSCFFILPSVQDIEHLFGQLEKGIQEYTVVVHGGLTKKLLNERWGKIARETHPLLIVGTPFFLAVPRTDIALIILDRESSGAYMRQGRPFIDLRDFAERFAEEIGADFILGDLFLRIETLYRKDRGEFESLLRPKFRVPSTARQSIVDMRETNEQPASGRIAVISAKLSERIAETHARGLQSFIFGTRRGYAPMTVCGDCGTVVPCTHCSAPLVLHKQRPAKPSGANVAVGSLAPQFVFLCHRCGEESPAQRMCGHCGSWKLTPLGIGIEEAEEALSARFPNATLLRLDRDVVKSHREAIHIVERFYKTPGSILIGTEMALAYLTEHVALSAVLSVNSLFSIPDFRMGERVFRLLLGIRAKASEHFLIQTRDPEEELFARATEGNIGDFLRAELAMRERLGYPPYTTLLKFTIETRAPSDRRILEDIERTFGAYHPVTFPSFIAKVKGKYRMNALIKIPRGDWPNDELLTLIRALPPEVEVRVNPESIL